MAFGSLPIGSFAAALAATQGANAGFQRAGNAVRKRQGPGPKKIRRRKRRAARLSTGLGGIGAGIAGG